MLVEMPALDQIRPYEENPRNNDAAVESVANSIREFGFNQPLVVDQHGVIIVGHTRFKAAKLLGLKEVPVYVAKNLTDAQARAYRIADNQTAALSSFDEAKLVAELMGLQSVGYEIAHTGFTAQELDELLASARGETPADPDMIPSPPTEPVTKPGDLIELGPHRLLCGDATNPTDVSRLLQGRRATMLFTDPPWNVAIGQDSNPRHRQRPGLTNDNLSPFLFGAFLRDVAFAIAKHVAGDVYCVLGASEWPTLDRALRDCGFHWSATIIWVKDAFVLGRSKFHRRYEPLWYGWHREGRSSFQGRRDLDDVWVPSVHPLF